MSQGRSFCVLCGVQLLEGAAFCQKCGGSVPSQAASSVGPKVPLLPPTAKVQQASGSAPKEESSPSTAGPNWLMPLVGLALVLVLMGVGIKLLKGQSGAQVAASPLATPQELQGQSQASQDPIPEPSVKPPAETNDPLVEDIPGIERIPLDRAESYLPLPRARYRHSLLYPDGDQGHREMVVAASDDARVTTVIEFTYSERFPEDPPGLWINHYVARPDGVYRSSDEEPDLAELWLPNDLALGKTWSNALGDFEVTAFDQTLVLHGMSFQGVLAYRQRSRALDLDQTIWLGLGHGEIQGRYGLEGAEFCRLLKVDSEPTSKIEELLKRHVVNLDKVR